MKPKVIVDREPVSSAEIQARKDFRNVLSSSQIVQKPFYTSTWFLSGMAVTFATVAVLVVTNLPSDNTDNGNTAQTEIQDSTKNNLVYEEDSPCIKAPIKGAEKAYSTYTVNSNGGSFTHSSGTVVSFEANSFVDANGNPVSGDIEIQYREFHDAPEIILSGIPMDYDSSGTTYAFSSAGMVDIRGFQNGQAVAIAPGKQIKVEMKSRYAGTEYNVYTLDTVAGNWVYQGKDVISSNSANSKPQNPNEPTRYDSTIARCEKDVKVANQQVAQVKRNEPVAPKKVDPLKYNFNIDADKREFPELSAFSGLRFEVGPENRGFTSAMYETEWDNAILKKGKGESYILQLMEGTAITELVVYPVYNEENYPAAKEMYDQAFEAYNKKLELKEADLKKKEEELAEAKRKRDEEIRQRNAIYNNQASTLDGSMLAVSGQAVSGGSIYAPGQVYNPSSVITRTFFSKGFGTVNCDSPKNYPSGNTVKPNFLHAAAKTVLHVITLYLVVPAKNLFFTYTPTSMPKLAMNENTPYYMVAILNDGKVGVVPMKNYAREELKEKYIDFNMAVTKEPVGTELELRRFLEEVH